MKKWYYLLVFISISVLASAQLYDNEWINYSQKYYKIKVINDGVYRIDSLTLAKAGINVSTIDPRSFQVFYHGQEQYIYVRGENSGIFSGKDGDYIEFYGQHNSGRYQSNDGASDSLLYNDTTMHTLPNPYYSLFCDTSTYFLTWNSKISGNKRMLLSNNNSFIIAPAAFFIAQSINAANTPGNTQYYEGYRIPLPNAESATDPRYTSAEGWMLPELDVSGTLPCNLLVSNVYTSGPNAIIKTLFAGESTEGTNDHRIQVIPSWSSTPITDIQFTGFQVFPETYTVPATQVAGAVLNFKSVFTYYGTSVTAVSYVSCQYPHTPNLGNASNFMMSVPDDTIGPLSSYYRFTNLNVLSTDSIRVYDLTNGRRIVVTDSNGVFKVLIPNSGGLKQCFITSDQQVNKVSQLIPVGNGGSFTDYTKGQPGSAYIIITHPSLMSTAISYNKYRGLHGYNVLNTPANIEELYDQFCYGIEKDPLAIKNFCNYALKNWPSPPGYLFLIGKGIHETIFRQDPVSFANTLVPSFGYPSSDVLLTAGLNGTSLQPAVSTGRIAAATQAEVNNYLAKVNTYETNTPALWQKRIIHFCGGAAGPEQAEFQNYLNEYEQIAVDTFFGAHVFNFSKVTSDPIQITLADSITTLINNGVSVMTFFGHASGSNFDINLDAPGNYNNYGKYPMIIADACFSGDIFQPLGSAQSSTSEQFVLDTKGSIGFLAADDLGLAGQLSLYTDSLYENFCVKNFRKPFGVCIQNTIKAQIPYAKTDQILQYTCLEMTLHGDPAISLLPLDSLPDFAVTDSSIYFTPANVTTQLDSFKLNLVVSNYAEAMNKPVVVQLERVFPDNSDTVYNITVKHIYYQDTITLKLPVNKIKGAGLNHFYINVNPSHLINEITYSNNTIGAPGILLWITSGDIIPVYPYQFAIIPNDTITLKASTGNPFASLHKYIFELDTTNKFNSPFLKAQIISAKGGVVVAPPQNWVNYAPMAISGGSLLSNGTPVSALRAIRGKGAPLYFKDSTVYYWQVRRDTSDMKDYAWEQSSFQYITNKNGWAQAHYYQFLKNGYTYLQPNQANRSWVFDKTGKMLQCNTYGMSLSSAGSHSTQLSATGYKLDYNGVAYAGCDYVQGIYVAVINPITLQPWFSGNYPQFGSNNTSGNPYGCGNGDYKFMYWYNNVSQMAGLSRLLDSVPDGYYILAYTWIEGMFQHWANPSTRNSFVNLGASSTIYTRPDSVPWIFFVQKGNKASVIEKIGRNNFDSLQLNVRLINNEPSGSMLSSLIGPAVKWDSISWRQHSASKKAKDSVRMSVIGVDNYGNTKTLVNGVPPAVASMYIKSINAKQYPYLQLLLYTKDTLTHIPSQMNKWQVFYTPVPEIAMNPSIYYSFHKDTVSVGDTVRFKTVVQNISALPMDSIILNSWISDANNGVHFLPVKRIKKLNPGDTVMVSAKTSSNGYQGNNSLWMEVNPQYMPQTRPEQYHFNNIARMNFIAIGDKINPLLDVTFDGIHILNNDIVSSHPNILITLMDENKYLALDYSDTSKIAIYIRNTNSNVSQRVYISNNSQIVFTPGTLTNNKCKVLYTPTLADGTYELTVQGADRSGNLSGSNVYKIDFDIINKSMISNILNYPNPFTTATRFVFTLTGDQIPTYFKIQIMTITGKIVKEITEAEIGPLHIGTNITQYAWDGTDQYGDRLANGIYLYHVTATINGQSIDHYSTDADSYFTKGWGKMYLMR